MTHAHISKNRWHQLFLLAWLALAGHAKTAEIIVDDGSTNSRNIAANDPASGSVWDSMAQSFTAMDSRISFGFRLKDENSSLPNRGALIIYRLYAGENMYATPIATRSIPMPSTLSNDTRSIFGDVGFVEADFSDVALAIGQRYTIEISVPLSSLPTEGNRLGISVWTSLVDPYVGGRFFFPVGYNNDFFSSQDMLFRIVPLSLSPAEQARALINVIYLSNNSLGVKASLGNILHFIDLNLSFGSARSIASACQQLDFFIKRVEQLAASRVVKDADAMNWIYLAGVIKTDVSCQ